MLVIGRSVGGRLCLRGSGPSCSSTAGLRSFTGPRRFGFAKGGEGGGGGSGSGARRRPFVQWAWFTAQWLAFKEAMGWEVVEEPAAKDVATKLTDARRLRRAKKPDAALHELYEALQLLKAYTKSPAIDWAETEIYDEMAQAYLEKGDLERGGELWRLVLSRILNVHGKLDTEPAFIQASLNLALVLAKRGQIIQAEVGYRHCLDKQEATAAAAIDAMIAGKGGQWTQRTEGYGPEYTDPQALLGSCLEHLAHFLLSTPPPPKSSEENVVEKVSASGKVTQVPMGATEARLAEAERCIWRAADISAQIAGPTSPHAIVLLNSFGVKALAHGRFELAAKILSDVARRAVESGAEVVAQLPAYYCNLAEALFHSGRRPEALDVARRALLLANSYQDAPAIRLHCREFVAAMEKDCEAGGVRESKSWEGWL